MWDARAHGLAHSRGALPNDSIAVLIDRRVCPRSPRRSKARLGERIAMLSLQTHGDLAPRSANPHV
jgi:hypothetical protein